MSKRRVIMARLVRRDEADREFDLKFWRRVGAEGRFAAMWEMVKTAILIRGGDERELRLQRSVQNIERRSRPVHHRRRARRRVSQ